jgi:hypothetical protein
MKNKPKYQKRILSKKVLTPDETRLLEGFIEKALLAYDREDIEYFILTLNKNHRDMNYFKGDKKEVEIIFDALIKDTKRHAELMEHIIKICE